MCTIRDYAFLCNGTNAMPNLQILDPKALIRNDWNPCRTMVPEVFSLAFTLPATYVIFY